MKIGEWRRFEPVSFLHGGDRSLVLLAHGDRPQLSMGLPVSGQGTSLRLRRVDLLSFVAFAERGETPKMTVGP